MRIDKAARVGICTIAMAAFAHCAWAEPDTHPIDAALSRCMETDEGMSTAGMLDCLDTATAAWDAELNRIWGELMKVVDADTKANLRASQRQWIAFRDAEIKALDSAYGSMQGSMFVPMHADAVATLTRDRVRQLDGLLDVYRIDAPEDGGSE